MTLTQKFPFYGIATEAAEHLVAIPAADQPGSQGIHTTAVIDDLFAQSADWIISQIEKLAEPALRIDFGFPGTGRINSGGGLPALASLIADQIKSSTGKQLASLVITKQDQKQTALTVSEAIPRRPPRAIATAAVTTRRSYTTPRFGEEIHDALSNIRSLANTHPRLALNLSYITGLPRTWSKLWLPTISGIFSNDSTAGRFNDAQIWNLGFHHLSAGEQLGHSVKISAWAYPVI